MASNTSPLAKDPLDLQQPWARLTGSPIVFALTLLAFVAGLRAYAYLSSEIIKGTPLLISYVAVWLAPVLFLTSRGRRQIGLGRPFPLKWISIGIAIGAAAAGACYLIGLILYGKGDEHWFVSRAYVFQSDERLALLSRELAFIAFSLPSLIAVSVGEEILFRGIIERSFRQRLLYQHACFVTAALFAVTQLLVHGVYKSVNGLEVMPLSGVVWFILMFILSLVFSWVRRRGQSLWPPIAAHAAFVLVANTSIFCSLLVTDLQTIAL